MTFQTFQEIDDIIATFGKALVNIITIISKKSLKSNKTQTKNKLILNGFQVSGRKQQLSL